MARSNRGRRTARYGPPNFEKAGVVSVWAATVPYRDIPADYFTEQREDEDAPLCRFAGEFGFGYYDHDQSEGNTAKRGLKSIGDLLGPCSYSSSFLAAAVAAAATKGLEKTSSIFMLFDFAYDPKRTGIERTEFYTFVGRFPWSDAEDDI